MTHGRLGRKTQLFSWDGDLPPSLVEPVAEWLDNVIWGVLETPAEFSIPRGEERDCDEGQVSCHRPGQPLLPGVAGEITSQTLWLASICIIVILKLILSSIFNIMFNYLCSRYLEGFLIYVIAVSSDPQTTISISPSQLSSCTPCQTAYISFYLTWVFYQTEVTTKTLVAMVST